MGDLAPLSSDDVDALTAKLIDEFRTRLEEAVILCIISDHDLIQQYDEVYRTLSVLAQDVAAEEASIFEHGSTDHDPATTHHHPADLHGLESSNSTETSQATTDSAYILSDISSNTDSLADEFGALRLPKDTHISTSTLDEEGKTDELRLMFPELSDFDLTFELKKANGDITKATDQLLFLQYLEENGGRPKGIEGAFREDHLVGHQNRSSTPKDKDKDRGKNLLDIGYRLKPINLSEGDHSSGKSAVSRPLIRRTSLPRLHISNAVVGNTPLSAPISPVVKTSGWQTVRPKKKTYSELVTEVVSSRAVASRTLESMHSAYRRGKSDAHFRTVAGVQAERFREQRAHVRRIEAELSEAFVDRTASSNSIDLHGVPVADGVQIALDKTHAWWINLGEDRNRKAREHGFIVVTGLGNHSASGVSRMRQEVGAALKREGWRVSVETGQYMVTGKN